MRNWRGARTQCEAVQFCGGEGGGGGGGVVAGEFEDVEACAEVGGVGEGLELFEEGEVGWGCGFFHFEEDGAGFAGEPAALGLEGGGWAAEGDGGLGEGCEVDVGGEVDEAGCFERVFGGAVVAEGAEGSAGSGGVVVFGLGEAVVDPDHVAVLEGLADGGEEGGEVGADFREVAVRE